MTTQNIPSEIITAEDKLRQIETVILCADAAITKQQILPEALISMSALKDIRRIVKTT